MLFVKRRVSHFPSFLSHSTHAAQCHAELVFAVVSALDAVCTVINDQSVTGAIRGALKLNLAHRTFKECERILEKKTNWSSEMSRDHFSSGVNLGLGAFELVISFFPQKFIRLLEFAGYCGDRAVGIGHLLKSEAIKTGFMHPWVSVLLSLYYGFLEYFYGKHMWRAIRRGSDRSLRA